MKSRKFLTIAAAVVFSSGIVMASPSTATNSNANAANSTTTTHHLMGTISSINSSDIVVSHQYKGSTKDSTFVLNSATKKEGTLAKGDRATIYYQVNNKRNVATDVKANPPKNS